MPFDPPRTTADVRLGERDKGLACVEEPDGVKQEGQTLSRPKSESSRLGIDRQRERLLVGSLTNSYKFKPDGLMKKVGANFFLDFLPADLGTRHFP